MFMSRKCHSLDADLLSSRASAAMNVT